MSNKPRTAQNREKLKDARALAMVDRRIHGRSLKQIAEEFGVSTHTVMRSLTRAEKLDLVGRYEDYLFGRLGALALGAYESALLENDTTVATKVLESLGIVRKPKEGASEPLDPGEESWEAILKVRRKQGEAGNAEGGQGTGVGPVVDAVMAEVSEEECVEPTHAGGVAGESGVEAPPETPERVEEAE